MTRSSSAGNSVTSLSPTPVMQNEAVKNQSFLQTSLGEISPSEQQQSQLSSVIGDITPENTSLSPPQDGQSNATENVSDILFLRMFLFYCRTYLWLQYMQCINTKELFIEVSMVHHSDFVIFIFLQGKLCVLTCVSKLLAWSLFPRVKKCYLSVVFAP